MSSNCKILITMLWLTMSTNNSDLMISQCTSIEICWFVTNCVKSSYNFPKQHLWTFILTCVSWDSHFQHLLATIPKKINDPWKTWNRMRGDIRYAFFSCFVKHSTKAKRLILWVNTAQTNFDKCHLPATSLFCGW